MSSKVLQLVNSAFLGPAVRIGSVRRAVVHLGKATIHNLVISETIFKAFDGARSIPEFDIEALQQESLLAAIVARQLFDGSEGDDAFGAALLKGVGQLVLAAQMPEYFGEVLRRAKATHGPLHLIENAMSSVNHAHVGAYLLGIWGLPPTIVQAVGEQFCPPTASHGKLPITSVVYVADRLIQDARMAAGSTGKDAPKLDNDWAIHSGLQNRVESWREIATRVLESGGARLYPRREMRWVAEWELYGNRTQGEIRDISPKGVFMSTEHTPGLDLKPGLEVLVVAEIPEAEPFSTRGTIRWVGHSSTHGCRGFGVELDHVSPELSACFNAA